MKTYSLNEMKDSYIGKKGTADRDQYEYQVRMEVIGKMIKTARLERRLTQEELGQLVGVQKSQISKLEKNASNARMDTILKVFKALKAEIHLNVKLQEQVISIH